MRYQTFGERANVGALASSMVVGARIAVPGSLQGRTIDGIAEELAVHQGACKFPIGGALCINRRWRNM